MDLSKGRTPQQGSRQRRTDIREAVRAAVKEHVGKSGLDSVLNEVEYLEKGPKTLTCRSPPGGCDDHPACEHKGGTGTSTDTQPAALTGLSSEAEGREIETGTQSGPRAQHPGPCCSVENRGRARRVEDLSQA